MSVNLRFVRVLTGIGCLAAAVSGCTSTVAGSASPATTRTTPTTPTAADVFAGLNACRVLEQLTAGQGFGPGENISRRNECDVLKPGFGSYGLALDPVQGLIEFAATNKTVVNTTINGRNAMQANIPTGGCAIAIEVGEHARAMVTVAMSRISEDPQSCPSARALAEKLEPLLPPGP
ncbi:DUF3558 family protein [Amycolatopsis viridis]|uniref:DUF3558 domain-containing protein n=1 Tax=Amycolatopsis viridis TaxID=185678 RepID=A0ABX0SKT9_9PSEU|nr:DUF3558 family protein [Amycolatopsis viridis]NIH77543.1 hypothetical protein [Amycolatopsis viridis]